MLANIGCLLDAPAATPGRVKDLAARYCLSSLFLNAAIHPQALTAKPPVPAADKRLPGIQLTDNDSALLAAIEAAHAAGLDVHLALADPFKGAAAWTELLAKDNGGCSAADLNPQQPELCPNRPKLVKWLAAAAADIAKTYKPAGILLNDFHLGSPDRIDPFFMCWCPTCRTRAAELGYDADRIGLALQGIRTKLTEARPGRAALDRPGIGQFIDALGYDTGIIDWLNFRADSISSCLFEIRKAVGAVDPNIRVLVATHAPSVAIFFGQRRSDLLRDATLADITVPILAGPQSGGLGFANLAAQILQRIEISLSESDALLAAAALMGHSLPAGARLGDNATILAAARRELNLALSAPTAIPQWPAIDTSGMPDDVRSQITDAILATPADGIIYMGDSA